jgi:hypothetical protein
MRSLVLLLMCLLAGVSQATDLTGKVVGPDGAAVGGATVMVYSATPKKGSPTTNPTEYPECSKSSATDSGSGAFAIDGVDPANVYELLVLSDTYRPLMLKKVDPARGQITAKLKAIPADVDPQLLVRGRVVDMNNNPITGAKIEVNSYGDNNSRTFGGESSVIDSFTYSNAKGEFTLVAKKTGLTFDLLLHARDAAPMIERIGSGEDSRDIAMNTGAHVTGRLVKDGQVLGGVKLNLVQQDRNSETFLDIQSTYTDETGRFRFAHVHPDFRYDIAPTMKSLAGRGWIERAPVDATGDDTTVDMGDIALESGQRISGQLVASSGNPDWTQAKLRLGRGDTWDDEFEISPDKEGHFEFKGAGGLCDLRVKLEGFHLSKDNTSAEPYRADYLEGQVGQDISDLKIQMDPGPVEQISQQYNQAEFQRLSSSQLSGVESK